MTCTKNLLLLCLSLAALSAAAQRPPSKSTKTKSMERFTIASFDQHKVNHEYTYSQDGKRVRQREYPERREYIEEIQDLKTPYKRIKVFYMESGNLKISGERFYSADVGSWEYYAANGTLEKRVNRDAPFRFSLNDLIAKMKATYQLDLMRYNQQVDVERSDEEDERPFYTVTFPVGPSGPGKVYIIAIDGVNGKEIEKSVNTVKH
jgi:hypothetical protein